MPDEEQIEKLSRSVGEVTDRINNVDRNVTRVEVEVSYISRSIDELKKSTSDHLVRKEEFEPLKDDFSRFKGLMYTIFAALAVALVTIGVKAFS